MFKCANKIKGQGWWWWSRDPDVAGEVTSEGEGVVTWHSEVRLLSILTQRGDTGEQTTGSQVHRQAGK